jgi:hypothetical protein
MSIVLLLQSVDRLDFEGHAIDQHNLFKSAYS